MKINKFQLLLSIVVGIQNGDNKTIYIYIYMYRSFVEILKIISMVIVWYSFASAMREKNSMLHFRLYVIQIIPSLFDIQMPLLKFPIQNPPPPHIYTY